MSKKYSAEFKITVIMDMLEHHMGYRETARKYWGVSRGEDLNYMNNVIRWERIYLKEGVGGLMKERNGGSAGSTRNENELTKTDKRAQEELIAENRRLRMEIEYLKKLSALVLAEERENGKKQK